MTAAGVFRALVAPHAAMPALWILVALAVLAGPFEFSPAPGAGTLAFVAGFVALYALASMMASDRERLAGPAPARPGAGAPSAGAGVLLERFGVIGLLGVACMVYDRVADAGTFDLVVLTQVRYDRAAELLVATELARKLSAYLGYLAYPCTYLVAVLGLLEYESLTRRQKLVAALSCTGPVLVALVAGGRSPILALILLLVAGCLARQLRGVPALPRSAPLRLALAAGTLAFLAYVNAVWIARLYFGDSFPEQLLLHAADEWGIEPSEALVDWALDGGYADLLVSVVSAYWYLFQGLTIMERMLAEPELPLLFGGQHIDLVAAAARMFDPTRQRLEDGYADLLDAHVYGYFLSAWGSLWIDLRWVAIPFVAAWGWSSGHAFAAVLRTRRLSYAVACTFLLYAILISPISAPFGLANSFSIFLYFALFILIARRTERVDR